MKNKKYLITGANGYLAKVIIKKLKSDNNNYIAGVIRKGSELSEDIKDLVDEVYSYDSEEMLYSNETQKLDFSKFDSVFHLATTFKADNSTETINALIENNLIATIALYKEIEKLEKQPNLVVTSSWSAYTGNDDFNPANPYSAIKHYAEQVADLFNIHTKAFLRVSDTYGPNDSRPKLHNLILRKENPIRNLNSPAKQEINFTHIEDIARAIIHADETNFNGIADLYYPENRITLGELVKLLKLDNEVTFGNKEIAPLPYQTFVLPDFKLKHDIKNIYNVLREDD